MFQLFIILWNSFVSALQELKVNKLRTFLSLFGITIGIFCIIGVLALVASLQNKVQQDVQSLGTNTIYIDKWEYSGGSDYPWWKFINRPTPKYEEAKFLKEHSSLAAYVNFFSNINSTVSYGNSELKNIAIFCVTEDFNKMQNIEIAYGRYLNSSEFIRGNAVCVIGYKVAEELFGRPEIAVGQTVSFDGKRLPVIGVIKKQGEALVGAGFNFDECVILSYRLFGSIYNLNEPNLQSFIMVNAQPNIPTAALMDELRGLMRQVRRLSPQQDDNFALNDVDVFSQQIGSFFGTVNIGGWAIAGLSLIVGAFGVANIMFVTVKERTSQIGLKKAVGAKNRTILFEFLLESAFLCVLGGVLGLLLVWILTLILSTILPFSIIIPANIIVLAFSICIILGMLSGFLPARAAARMNPVEAIKSA
jgi:putative ABC transport system permease protein